MSPRCSIDSNVLVYAELEPKTTKGLVAQQVIELVAQDGILANQALLEFVAVVRRRLPSSLPSAVAKAEAWAQVFETAPTNEAVMSAALRLVTAHRFQVWDAVIWAAARGAGATILFSEDLQDGVSFEGLRVVNPFAHTPAELNALLSS